MTSRDAGIRHYFKTVTTLVFLSISQTSEATKPGQKEQPPPPKKKEAKKKTKQNKTTLKLNDLV